MVLVLGILKEFLKVMTECGINDN